MKSGLIISLGLGCYFVLRINYLGTADDEEAKYQCGFLGVILVGFFSLLFHALSDRGMGNFYGDQAFQPMLPLAAGVLVMCAANAFKSIEQTCVGRRTRLFLVAALSFWLFGMAVPRGCEFIKLLASCRLRPSGIHYMRGATISGDASGVVELTTRLRTLVQTNQTVLLLPDDPNLESWFDRKRPVTSCPIVFSDQYWERYVEEDFKRLNSLPPDAIIVGPRIEMQGAYQWSLGAQKLINLVRNQLIPKEYTLAFTQSFLYKGQEDFFDVYLLSSRSRIQE